MFEDKVELIRRGYDAYASGDFPTVFALLHPDIEIYQTELLPWGGTYRGHEQARDFFRKLNELTDGRPEPAGFISAGDDVVATGRLRGRVRANGQAYDLAIVHVWSIREGRAVRFAAYIDTPGMLSALAGSESVTPA
jgi:ketosteroid isomerase-like protein